MCQFCFERPDLMGTEDCHCFCHKDPVICKHPDHCPSCDVIARVVRNGPRPISDALSQSKINGTATCNCYCHVDESKGQRVWGLRHPVHCFTCRADDARLWEDQHGRLLYYTPELEDGAGLAMTDLAPADPRKQYEDEVSRRYADGITWKAAIDYQYLHNLVVRSWDTDRIIREGLKKEGGKKET